MLLTFNNSLKDSSTQPTLINETRSILRFHLYTPILWPKSPGTKSATSIEKNTIAFGNSFKHYPHYRK